MTVVTIGSPGLPSLLLSRTQRGCTALSVCVAYQPFTTLMSLMIAGIWPATADWPDASAYTARNEFPGCGPDVIGPGAAAPDGGSGSGIVLGVVLPEPSGACTAIFAGRQAAAPRRRVRGAYA